MTRYLLRRLAMALGVAFTVLVVMSALVRFIPGDPATAILRERATPELIAQVRQEMGLDRPVYEQVWNYLQGAVRGDLGTAIFGDRPVTNMIGEALPHTIILALSAISVATVVAIPLGLLAAARPGSLVDRVLGLTSIAAISIPSLVAGLLLLIVFGVKFGMFPILGAGDLSNPADYARHLLLPSIAIAIAWAGYLARLLRASLVDVLGATYIRVGRAFGLSNSVIFMRYALKNAIVPTMAVIGYALAVLMGGSLFVEVIFTRPGIGNLLYRAIVTRDYQVVQGTVITVSLLFITVNLIVDLAYRLVDPRVRVEEGHRS